MTEITGASEQNVSCSDVTANTSMAVLMVYKFMKSHETSTGIQIYFCVAKCMRVCQGRRTVHTRAINLTVKAVKTLRTKDTFLRQLTVCSQLHSYSSAGGGGSLLRSDQKQVGEPKNGEHAQ
jgi:hypothetical protein